MRNRNGQLRLSGQLGIQVGSESSLNKWHVLIGYPCEFGKLTLSQTLNHPIQSHTSIAHKQVSHF
jgi:hypothetical protein